VEILPTKARYFAKEGMKGDLNTLTTGSEIVSWIYLHCKLVAKNATFPYGVL